VELSAILCQSTDLRQVLTGAYDQLARSLSADYAALGVSAIGNPAEYEWHVARIPEAFFRAYGEMVGHDFVRAAALRHPNVVLSDEQMIARGQLHRNPLYVRASELGVKLERVLAVMLDPRAAWHGGFILYRDGRLPFSDPERRELQAAVPLLTGAVQASRLLQRAQARGDLFERLARLHGSEVLVVDGRGREQWRTAGLEALLRRHFPLSGSRSGPLPGPLSSRLASLLREEPPPPSVRLSMANLEISFLRLPPGRWWAVVLEDLMPARWWSVLTPREVEVAYGVLRGWDNELISDELKCGGVPQARRPQPRQADRPGAGGAVTRPHRSRSGPEPPTPVPATRPWSTCCRSGSLASRLSAARPVARSGMDPAELTAPVRVRGSTRGPTTSSGPCCVARVSSTLRFIPRSSAGATIR